jgi:hypothetical protein
MKQAYEWLQHCDRKEGHRKCQVGQLGNRSTLPRRLLCVNPKSKLGPDNIVLIEADSSNSKHAEYACLSYRWGVDKDTILRTTSENFDQHHESIILQDLPQTIIDAVKVCRKLKIHYLWVDSLCIIQPKKGESLTSDEVANQDWLQEGSTMDKAYGNSYLTIYAESPSSCTAGFLRDSKFGCTSSPSDHDADWSDDSDNEYTEPLGSDGGGSVLRSRGWCLQEYLIPNRRLRFFESEMVWECNCCQMCQCSPQRSSPLTRDRLSDIKPTRVLYERRPEPISFDHVREWGKIVEDYSSRSIASPETNKLMGVHGVANLLSEASGKTAQGQDRYVAGLWTSDLQTGLSWVSLRSKNCHRRLQGSAPTWSWASIDGPVTFQTSPSFTPSSSHPMVRCSNIDSISVHLTKESASTPEGYVSLTGSLVPIQLASLDEQLSKRWDSTHEQSLRPICLVRSSNMESYPVILDFDTVDGAVELHTNSSSVACWMEKKCLCGSSNDSCFSDAQRFFALRMHTWEESKEPKHKGHITWSKGRKRQGRVPSEVWYLVLKEIEPDRYERIGMGHHSVRNYTRLFDDSVQPKEINIV